LRRFLLACALLAALAVLPSPASAGTPVRDAIAGAVTWTEAGSPYWVEANVTVLEGAMLTIEANATVLFADGTGLQVLGALEVRGNETHRVRFASNATVPPPPGAWAGLRIEANGSRLDNLTIEDADVGLLVANASLAAWGVSVIHVRTAVAVINGSLTAGRMAVTGSEGTALTAEDATVSFSGAQFSDNVRAVQASGSTLTFTDSAFRTSFIREFNLTATGLRLLNTTTEGAPLLDAASVIDDVQRLSVQVIDRFGTPVQAATVVITDNRSAAGSYGTDVDGGIGVIELVRSRRNATAVEVLEPYSIEASKGVAVNSTTLNLTARIRLLLGLAGDFLPPTAVGPDLIAADEDILVPLDATASTDNDPDLNYTWNFGDGRKSVTLHGAYAEYAWETPGLYTVRLTVRDTAGLSDEVLFPVTIFDRTGPEVQITATAYVQAGAVTSLVGNATDNDLGFPAGANYTWTITGPATMSLYGPLVNVTYPLPGRYTVTLTVRDAAGNNGTQAQSVDVAPAPAGDLTLPTILLSALALAAGAWYGGTDRGWAALLHFLILPLYTRIRDEKVLDQFTRGQIYGYVRVHPGDSFTDLKRNLQLENGVLAYHLQVLEKEGLVRSRTKGTRRLYFSLESVPVEDGGLHELQQRMIEVLAAKPGLTVRELADALGVSRQLAIYHLRALTSQGKARVARDGFKIKCYAQEGPAASPSAGPGVEGP